MICEEKFYDFLVHTKTGSSAWKCNMMWHVESITELEYIDA